MSFEQQKFEADNNCVIPLTMDVANSSQKTVSVNQRLDTTALIYS